MSVSSMKKLTVLAYSTDADAILRRLMQLRCVDIRTVETVDGVKTERLDCDVQRVQAEQRLTQIRAAIPLLAKYSTRKKKLGRSLHRVDRAAFEADGRADAAWQTVEDALRFKQTAEALTAEQTRNRALANSLQPWLEYDAPLNAVGSAHTQILLASGPSKMLGLEAQEALSAAGAYVEPVWEDEGGTYLALTCCAEDTDAVQKALTERGGLRISFPEVSEPANQALERVQARLGEIDLELLKIEEQIRECAEQLDAIEILYDVEATKVALCQQKKKMAKTRRCAILQGWVPEARQDAVTEALSKFECACELAVPDEDDEVPVQLRNGRFSSTFEWVIGMYSYPKYGTFDPTFIMSIFYFLIFGMMFADVGYGLLLTLGCFLGVKILNPKPGMRQMMIMFGYCGISCMLMGVLFGGWFGNLPTALMNSFIPEMNGVAETTPLGSFFYNGLLFNPIDSSTAFLVLSLAVGEIHLIVGMAINMIQTCKKQSVLEGICSTVPYWILFAGLDLLVPGAVVDMVVSDPASVSESTRALFAQMGSIGGYVALVGFVSILLFKGVGQKSFTGWLVKGLGGLYALISFASDLLSYSRILALGLVAGVIAQVVNMMTGLGATGPVGFVFMLIVMILGHVLNLAINLLGTFVHAARLQYIEFFGKFYEDGGDPFTPALPTEEYSEDLSSLS